MNRRHRIQLYISTVAGRYDGSNVGNLLGTISSLFVAPFKSAARIVLTDMGLRNCMASTDLK